jgi:RND family efflux transporter MFP subunit
MTSQQSASAESSTQESTMDAPSIELSTIEQSEIPGSSSQRAAIESWLARQCELADGVDRGIVILPSFGSSPAARWPADLRDMSELASIANAALTDRSVRTEETPPSDLAPLGYCLLAVPFSAGPLVGVIAVEIGDTKESDVLPVADLLRLGALWLEVLMTRPEPKGRGMVALDVAALALEQSCLRSTITTVVSELAIHLQCERVSLGLQRHGAMKVQAMSHTAKFDAQSNAIQKIGAAMEEAAEQDATIAFPPLADRRVRITREHEQLAQEHDRGATLTVPMADEGHVIGALTFERVGLGFDAQAQSDCEDAAAILGPILALRDAAEVGAMRRMGDWLSERLSELRGPDHPRARLVAACFAAFVLLLGLANGDHRVTADATIEGRIQRAIVSGLDGYIAEANARAGDLVKRGEPLGSLDDRDLRLERRKWMGRREQLKKEYREALSGLDRAQLNIVSARIAQAEAQLDLVDGDLARTRLVAPFDGVVVRGDLSQSLGSPVSKGDVLFELAPLEGYRVILRVDERDVSYLKPGEKGQLALSATPGERLAFTVDRITPVASALDGQNTFRVEAAVDAQAAALRPGLEGVAKIDVGRRRLVWIWTHELLDWIRLWAWSWWP